MRITNVKAIAIQAEFVAPRFVSSWSPTKTMLPISAAREQLAGQHPNRVGQNVAKKSAATPVDDADKDGRWST
jgi:hypothetical protein